MPFDVRLPLGYLLLTLGLLLAGFGLDPGYALSLGYNVGLVWGAMLGLGGALCLVLARRSEVAPSDLGALGRDRPAVASPGAASGPPAAVDRPRDVDG